MASVSTAVSIHGAALNSLLSGPNGPVARDLERRGARILDRAQTLAPRATGRLASALTSRLFSVGGTIEVRVGIFGAAARSVPYLQYVLKGTNTPIRPRRAQVLRFVVNGRVIYAKEVRGQVPNNFLLQALQAGGD